MLDRRFWTLVAVAIMPLAIPVAAQEIVADPAPTRPDGMAESFVAPPHAADGAYVTPNRSLTADEATWHLRVALNVAALNCRDAQEAVTVAGYNALLADRKAALAAAGEGMAATYRERFGAAWQARHDDAMTRLYNFWAQPPAHDGFCAAAQAILKEATTVEPSAFTDFVGTSLARLEAPFVAAYATADGYHAEVAAWRARHAPAVIIATATAGPVIPVAVVEEEH